MIAENRHYGHAEILLAYCALPSSTRISVRPQHGWQPGIGMRPRDMAQPGAKIVWSSRNLERARTVCLYWHEYEQADLRELFERRGCATTTMGHRDDNPEFLRRQRGLIRRHAFVSSNRVSTASFHALAAGGSFLLRSDRA